MNALFRSRWLTIFAAAALAFAGIRLTASGLLPGAQQRLVQQYRNRILALPEDQAARFVTRLAEKDAPWPEVLVLATADDRPLVAGAAERELRSLVLRLTQLPADESSPQAARLARALALAAAELPPDRRSLMNSLAQQLIVWPIDGRTADAAQFIADCEAVLLLPVAEPIEIRLAAAPPARQEQVSPPGSPELSPAEPALQQPPAVLITEPALPPAATPPSLNEPQLFVPGRTLRISDE
jgi:hypothetical protein